MLPIARCLLPLLLPAALLCGSCSDAPPGGGGERAPAAVTTEKELADLLARAGTAPLPGSAYRGATRTTSGMRFAYHSPYSCASCRRSALSFYRGAFARALAKGGWQRTPLSLPHRFGFRRGQERLIVEVGSDAEAAVDGRLRTFITHGIR
jgi:hypothetical protein